MNNSLVGIEVQGGYIHMMTKLTVQRNDNYFGVVNSRKKIKRIEKIK